MELCKACFELDYVKVLKYADPYSDADVGDGHISFSVPVPKVDTQRLRGCTLCQLLMHGVDHFGPRMKDWKPESARLQIVANLGRALNVRLCHGAEAFTIEFCTYEDSKLWLYNPWTKFDVGNFTHPSHLAPPSPWDYLGIARKIPISIISDECKTAVDSWIRNCISTHGSCKPTSSNFLPKRLVDVSRPQQPFLRETNDSSSSTYVALSHRWPKASIPTTTKETIQSRKNGIPWSDLTLNYREAIEVVRWLNIQYIWIDSLCIVQDDRSDWEEQAALMADIYENAYVTLTTRPGTEGGSCLVQRDEVITVHVDSKTKGFTVPIFVRPYYLHDFLYNQDSRADVHNPKVADNVSARGWCFQERMLSTRILHLTPFEIVFECGEITECECRSTCDHGTANLPSALKAQWSSRDTESPVLWRHIIESYTTKSLTYETDTLPALSGIAKRMFSDHLGFTNYLAGVWDQNLAFYLTWVTYPRLGIRRDTYIAPSFSWASVRGGCTLHCRYNDYLESTQPFELLEAVGKQKGKNPWGEITSCYLRISGYLYSTNLTHVNGEAVGPPESGTFRCTTAPSSARSTFAIQIDTIEDARLFSQGISFHLLEILIWYDVAKALVLVENSGNKSYRRIGLAEGIDGLLFSGLPASEIIII